MQEHRLSCRWCLTQFTSDKTRYQSPTPLTGFQDWTGRPTFSNFFRLVKTHPNITFGSYPSWIGQHYRTKVTFEGESEEEVSRARSDIEQLEPIKFDPKPTENACEKVQQFLQDTAYSHTTCPRLRLQWHSWAEAEFLLKPN